MKNNVNTTKTQNTAAWLVFYIESATGSHFGTLKQKEFVKEGNALKFARKHDSEVLPIVEGNVID